VDLLLADLARRLATQDLTLDLTPAARALIVREGTDPTYGARPLKRTIQRLVENPLARSIVAGQFRAGDTVTADADLTSGTLRFSTDETTVLGDDVRRDARTRTGEPIGVGVGAQAPSPLDLPPVPRRKPGDDELVN
jgi:ATP-dependent Clp protease ATP-binding subunit ClpC